jgi:hypothetical protein
MDRWRIGASLLGRHQKPESDTSQARPDGCARRLVSTGRTSSNHRWRRWAPHVPAITVAGESSGEQSYDRYFNSRRNTVMNILLGEEHRALRRITPYHPPGRRFLRSVAPIIVSGVERARARDIIPSAGERPPVAAPSCVLTRQERFLQWSMKVLR